ncbi:LysR substrate-binding domain-containing protein [Mesorhizobium sp.]|uniref:LysR substrate-binding domain-containing protein n=1 Tax=Mesorhizobium sp. TaxID=1871066 RepID=UPI000FE2F13A|nr:LysR substrate-binding domain-containing protein [Mesorhizobium sp.]RWJ96304.1 MAG: LysR family transcriptional regulator [Mesorhizobium sp.]TIN06136.1 MAG: LysR family transcriptional regulator [Mesorhizobium sp.]
MRRYLPSLSALHAFEAAARYMNFTRAADDLGLTQSGISRQIKNLEEFLGVTLFQRSGPRLVLTDLGVVYYREVALVLDKLQEVSIDAVRGRALDSSVMLGTLPTLGSRWVPTRLGPLISANPNIPLEIIVTTPDVDFETTRLDIAMLRGLGTWTNARSIELFAEEIAVVAAPRLIHPGTTLHPRDFAKFPMLQNASRQSMWLRWLSLLDLEYHGRIQGPRFAHSDMIINAAVNGAGIAIVPLCYIELELARGELHMPFGPPVLSEESYYVVYPERKAHNKNVVVVRDWLIQESTAYRRVKGRSPA